MNNQSHPVKGRLSSANFQITDNTLYVMSRILRGFEKYMSSALLQKGLKLPTWRVLWALQEIGQQNIGELSDATTIERSTLSRIIDSMEKNELVRSMPSKPDRRYTKTFLTPRGRRQYEEILPISKELVDWALAGLSKKELDDLSQLLKRVQDNIERPVYQARPSSA